MKKVLGLIIAALIAGPAVAKPVIAITDGDTVRIDGSNGLRLLGLDTPETWKPRCENELKLGLDAKQRLRELLDSGEVKYVISHTDHYGKTDRWQREFVELYVIVDGKTIDVDETMVSEGFGFVWKPGKVEKQKRLNAWCPNGATW